MRSLVVYKQAEWFIPVSFFQKFNGMVGDQVGYIAFLFHIFSIRFFTPETRIIVFTLIPQDMIVIKALRFTTHVPLTNYSGFITILLKYLRYKYMRSVNARIQTTLPALMAIQPRHQASTTGSRQRVLNKRLPEQHTFRGQAIQIGSRSLHGKRMSVSTNGLIRMIIRHNVDDIRTLLHFFLCRGIRQHKKHRHRCTNKVHFVIHVLLFFQSRQTQLIYQCLIDINIHIFIMRFK